MKHEVGERGELVLSLLLSCFFFFFWHANALVPSLQSNCFTSCKGRPVWRRQSNFHMNNYPAVRVGSSFISIWLTGRTMLTKEASSGTGGGLMGQVHFSGIQLLWPKYANTFKVACDLRSAWTTLSLLSPHVCACPSSYACALVFLWPLVYVWLLWCMTMSQGVWA